MKINKKFLGVVASIVIGVGLLVFVLIKYPIKNVIATFSNITPVLLIAYLCVSFAIMLLFATRWKFVLKTLGYEVPFMEVFSFRVMEYGISFLTPSGKAGGEPVRAALLSTKRGIPFKEGLATVMTDKTIELSVSVLFFVFGMLILALGYSLPKGLSFFIVIASVFLLYLVWTFYSRILNGKPIFSALYKTLRLHKIKFLAKYEHAVVDFEKPIIKFYTEKRKAFFIALGISILSLLCSLVEFKLLLLMLGINASLAVVFMVFSVVGFAFLIPVPMGLGSLEALQVSLFSVLKIGSAAGIGLAMITRARDLLWVLTGVVFSLYFGAFKTVLKEAYDSKHNNPLMRATIFRDGKSKSISLRLRRPKVHEGFITLNALRKRCVDFYKAKKPVPPIQPEARRLEQKKFWKSK